MRYVCRHSLEESRCGHCCRDDHTAEKDARPRCPETRNGIPCQKRVIRLSDGTWDHGGGHWFMSDDLTACMDAGHFDPANVLAMTPLVHLDVPCPRRVTPPGTITSIEDLK